MAYLKKKKNSFYFLVISERIQKLIQRKFLFWQWIAAIDHGRISKSDILINNISNLNIYLIIRVRQWAMGKTAVIFLNLSVSKPPLIVVSVRHRLWTCEKTVACYTPTERWPNSTWAWWTRRWTIATGRCASTDGRWTPNCTKRKRCADWANRRRPKSCWTMSLRTRVLTRPRGYKVSGYDPCGSRGPFAGSWFLLLNRFYF